MGRLDELVKDREQLLKNLRIKLRETIKKELRKNLNTCAQALRNNANSARGEVKQRQLRDRLDAQAEQLLGDGQSMMNGLSDEDYEEDEQEESDNDTSPNAALEEEELDKGRQAPKQ